MNSDSKILSSEEEKSTLLKELMYQNENLKMTIESIGDSVITIDNKGKITSLNKAAQVLSGWDRENAIGMEFHNVFKLVNGKYRDNIKMSFDNLLDKHLPVGVKADTILISKNGSEYFVSATISNILDERNKKVVGVVILLRDITRVKMLEDEVKREKEQALAANTAKSIFLASMSHEIRTPLNGIEGMIDLTLLTELTQEQRENLNIAKECSKSLMDVINNILDFSKIEAGKMVAINKEFKVSDLIEMVFNLNIVHAKVKGIEFISKLDGEINRSYIGDYGKIQQILNNLISNAIKFTKKGSVCLETKMLCDDSNTSLFKFSVIDTGIGISSADSEKLFKSFSQVDGTNTRKYGGTGLGLIISKKLAEIIGGSILVESTKDIGSTFSLTIKIEKSNNNQECQENRKNNLLEKVVGDTDKNAVDYMPSGETDDTKDTENGKKYNDSSNIFNSISKRILIVEDNKANQMVLRRMCTIMSHKVKVADNGKKALEILNSDFFDVILMDVQMPILNGIEATAIIRENEKISGKHIPIIALTAYALVGDREKFLKLGMDDYLSKPLMMEDLKKCIDGVVANENSEYHDALYYLNIEQVDNELEDHITYLHEIFTEIIEFKKHIDKKDYIGCENSSHVIMEYSLKEKSVIMKNASFRAELAARRKDIDGLNMQIRVIEQEYNRLNKSV